ncbi:MAG TPA: hypothetical protein VE959_05440 [Bryobacteraceae bacterium]|nr:hypothetical protein [Bryobacteraceae bacterium]
MKKSAVLAGLFAAMVFGQQPGVNSRGDHAMGFSHEKTIHHFRLFTDGGAIEVEANDAQDTESRDQIRMHLKHIARMFSEGNFEIPMFVHDQTPPGAAVMKRLADRIRYEFADTARGGRVRITSPSTEAVKAVHDFLRFQIKDHQTGDVLEITKPPAQ